MKIFITGATGFIGNHLATRLAKEHDVTALVRNPVYNDEFRRKNIKTLKGDIFNEQALRSGMEGCDWVFHLAAYARPTSFDKELPWKTNVVGTVNVLRAAEAEKVRKVVITSTGGTVGYSRDGRPVDEETNRDIEYHTDYERSKAEVEKIAFFSSSQAMNVIVVNPTRVFGPGRVSKSNSVTRIIDLYGKGLWRIIPGDGTSIGNYVFIDDVVNGHILAALHGKGGQRYILGGENISFNEFFDITGKVYANRRRMLRISNSDLKRIAHIQGFFSGIIGRPPLISGNWIDKYLQNWIISSNKAINDLSYSITPFEEGVLQTVRWLKTGRYNAG